MKYCSDQCTLMVSKTLKDEEDNWTEAQSNTSPMPPSLSLLSAQQTLELLLYLSQMHSYVPMNFPSTRICEIPREKSSDLVSEISETSSSMVNINQEEISEFRNENDSHLGLAESTNDSVAEMPIKIVEKSNKNADEATNLSPILDVGKITDEICQEKFEELKRLLNTAHEAVTSIVHPPDNSNLCPKDSIKEDNKNECVTTKTEKMPPEDFVTLKPSPSASRSSSGSREDRAGKYNKKPAPRAPSEAETTPQQTLKATLVIKTGTVKTFTNLSNSKNVFVNHPPESSKSKKKRKSRDGFSKFLALPKNIFNSTFHKDVNSRSRSVSVDSGQINYHDCDNTKTMDVEDLLLKAAIVGTDEITDCCVDFRTDTRGDRCDVDKLESNETIGE